MINRKIETEMCVENARFIPVGVAREGKKCELGKKSQAYIHS